MHYVALKPLPHGQQPGDVFEESDAVGNVLILAGAARQATEDEIKPKRSGYRRRDMQAKK